MIKKQKKKKIKKKIKKKVQPVVQKPPSPKIIEKPPPKDYSRTDAMYAEMEKELHKYKRQLLFNIQSEKQKGIDFLEFKEVFFPKLENMLVNLKNLTDLDIRETETESTFEWFSKEIKTNKDLQTIFYKTGSSTFEKVKEKIPTKDAENYLAINFPEKFEFEHRTAEVNLEPPKDKLKSFITHHIGKDKEPDIPKKRLMSGSSSKFNSTNYQTKYSTKIGFFKANKDGQLRETAAPQENMLKSSFGFFRPKYDLHSLMSENMFLMGKHREIAQKRNEEEREQMLDTWGMAKGAKQEDLFMRREMKRWWKGKDKEYDVKVVNVDNDYDKEEDEIEADSQIEPVFLNEAERHDSEADTEGKKKVTKNTIKSRLSERMSSRPAESLGDNSVRGDAMQEVSSVRDRVDSQVIFENNPEEEIRPYSKVDFGDFNTTQQPRETSFKVDQEFKRMPVKEESKIPLLNEKTIKDKIIDNYVEKARLDSDFQISSQITSYSNLTRPVSKARELFSKSNGFANFSYKKDNYIVRGNPLSANDLSNIPKQKLVNRPKTSGVASLKTNLVRQTGDMLSQRQRLSVFNNHEVSNLNAFLRDRNSQIDYRRLKSAFQAESELQQNKFELPKVEDSLFPRTDKPKKRNKKTK